MNTSSLNQSKITLIGHFLGKHQRAIRLIQWVIILFYAVLVIAPAISEIPSQNATIYNNLTIFAQFMFWGIWWPFVLLSMVMFGRLWCGVLCPEGALTEFANKFGAKRAIPRWMRWGGWPFVTFSLTTIYGQITSVYQYPKPVLLVLGGSTIAAIIIGLIYGKSSRIWCKYLCPVTGVFAMLSKLAPWHFKPDKRQWDEYNKINHNKVIQIHCPTVLPLRTMTGASECLMCGKCNNHRQAIKLTKRSPNQEIVTYGAKDQSIWGSILILYGLCGIALAAFQWPNSFWLSHFRDYIDSWFIVHNITWVFNTTAPWWLMTNYPEQGDSFSWLFGLEVLSYMVIIGLIIGLINTIVLSLANLSLGGWQSKRFNHLVQALIPLGACSVFVGLVANTFSILEKYANIGFTWSIQFRYILLILAMLWCGVLAWQIIKQYTDSILRRAFSFGFILIDCFIINYSWILVLHIWSVKADSIPWNTLWL